MPEPAGMYIWSEHWFSYAGKPTHLVWIHVAVSHQSYKNLLLQVAFLAAQTPGKLGTAFNPYKFICLYFPPVGPKILK